MTAEVVAALWAEVLKIRHSIVVWITVAAAMLAGLVGAFFMFVLQDLDRARSIGLLGTKALLNSGSADWPGYFALTAQTAAVGGLIIFGIIMIWLFGREFADRTAKDLLALPTSRTAVVLAKFLAAYIWCLALTLLLVGLTLAFGTILDLPGWSPAAGLHGAGAVLSTGALTTGLVTTYALVASAARGYLASIGAMILTVFAAQVITAAGYGAWFPWAVPALTAGLAGPTQAPPGIAGPTSVLLVAVLSVLATLMWWNRADHTQ